MVAIQVDEKTALELEHQARAAGLTIAEYLGTLIASSSDEERPSWEEIERQFMALSTDGSSLPADFSRADIYGS